MEFINEYFIVSFLSLTFIIFFLVVFLKKLDYYENKNTIVLKERYKYLLKYASIGGDINKYYLEEQKKYNKKSILFLKFVFKNQENEDFKLLIHFLDNLNYYLKTIDNYSVDLSMIQECNNDTILDEGVVLYSQLLDFRKKVIDIFVVLIENYNSDVFLNYKFEFIDQLRLEFKTGFNKLKAESNFLLPIIIEKIDSM